jgi:UDP-N-acetylmuramoyl-L-alanyl-D-glutamate--2,6-diaminopimelate ligase
VNLLNYINELTTAYLADKSQGKLIGENKNITGIFNILKDANVGDVVIRHWIDETGVEMAHDKGVSCLVTQDPRGSALEMAEKLNLPLILTERIELANVFALRWALNKFAKDTLRVVVTGTNGKSTTSHMIHRILHEAGYTVYTNTDAESEFNTLIDPMVAKQIAEFPGKLEALVLEVSEVQGWEERIMVDHAHLMTKAIQPQVVVLTNVALDHIGLVNSLEDVFQEISGALRDFNGDYVILNSDDPLIKKMEGMLPSDVGVVFYGDGSVVDYRQEGIFQGGKLLIPRKNLPFQSKHFIQNTMAAVGFGNALKIDPKVMKRAISSYQPLKRRFTIIKQDPLIIDDFAHNPDGIMATIKSTTELCSGKLYLVCAIRGSRGDSINCFNAQAVADSLKNVNHNLILTSSKEVVDEANRVKPGEKKVFIEVMQKEGIGYSHEDQLVDALKKALRSANKTDTILLIGAQGMDPASNLLEQIDDLSRDEY